MAYLLQFESLQSIGANRTAVAWRIRNKVHFILQLYLRQIDKNPSDMIRLMIRYDKYRPFSGQGASANCVFDFQRFDLGVNGEMIVLHSLRQGH